MMSQTHARLPATGDDPLPELVRGLRSHLLTNRLRAAKDLARLGWLARDAMPSLVAVLDDDDPKVREACAQAIGTMGLDALPTLAGMLLHSDKYVRRHAVWAIGKLGPLARSVLRDLCASLKDADPRTASGAAQAIGNMGTDGTEAIPALAEAMRGTNIVLCRLAAKALSQIGRPALSTLIAHLQHTDPFVRGESALAIGWMGPAARSAVPFLVNVVRGPRAALTPTPAPGDTPFTGRPGLDAEMAVGSQTVTPTHVPVPATATSDDGCRAHAAQALGRIGPQAAAALIVLRESARTGPDALRTAAQQAVRLIEGTTDPAK